MGSSAKGQVSQNQDSLGTGRAKPELALWLLFLEGCEENKWLPTMMQNWAGQAAGECPGVNGHLSLDTPSPSVKWEAIFSGLCHYVSVNKGHNS